MPNPPRRSPAPMPFMRAVTAASGRHPQPTRTARACPAECLPLSVVGHTSNRKRQALPAVHAQPIPLSGTCRPYVRSAAYPCFQERPAPTGYALPSGASRRILRMRPARAVGLRPCPYRRRTSAPFLVISPLRIRERKHPQWALDSSQRIRPAAFLFTS